MLLLIEIDRAASINVHVVVKIQIGGLAAATKPIWQDGLQKVMKDPGEGDER